jgi:hypothetical protein
VEIFPSVPNKVQVPGSRFQIPGSRFQIPARFRVPDSRFLQASESSKLLSVCIGSLTIIRLKSNFYNSDINLNKMGKGSGSGCHGGGGKQVGRF